MASVLPAFVEGLPAGVEQVALPTPFHMGGVNCYVLLEPPVTVIDPGTLQPGSLARLRAALNANGLDFDAVEQIVVTHAHADHAGAAAVLAARAEARIVCALPEVASLVEPPDVALRHEVLRRLGVPDAIAGELVETADAAVQRVARRAHPGMVHGVSDGDLLLAGGRRLVSVVTAGHAEGHLSLWDPGARVLFSGDHLLARIIPAPTLYGSEGLRRHSLSEYLASLSRFVALGPEVVLPGHGRAFREVDVLSARLHAHSQQRVDQIAQLLRAGPATPYEVALGLQWRPEGARLLFGLAHSHGHLELLSDAGRAIAEDDGGVMRYRLPRSVS